MRTRASADVKISWWVRKRKRAETLAGLQDAWNVLGETSRGKSVRVFKERKRRKEGELHEVMKISENDEKTKRLFFES